MKRGTRVMPNAFRGHRIYFNEALRSLFTISSLLLFWVCVALFQQTFHQLKVRRKKEKTKTKYTRPERATTWRRSQRLSNIEIFMVQHFIRYYGNCSVGNYKVTQLCDACVRAHTHKCVRSCESMCAPDWVCERVHVRKRERKNQWL